MQIFLRTCTGTCVLNASLSDSVRDLKEQLPGKSGSGFRVTLGGRTLEDHLPLAHYNIQPETTLDQVLNLQGGHCQVPCGIFDDPRLVAEVQEQVATIRKAMAQLQALHAKTDAGSVNQRLRWCSTKEEHANRIIRSISEYGLCQRVKPLGAATSPFRDEAEYEVALRAHHLVMVKAMVAKQSVEATAAEALELAVGDWSKMYLPTEAVRSECSKRKLGDLSGASS